MLKRIVTIFLVTLFAMVMNIEVLSQATRECHEDDCLSKTQFLITITVKFNYNIPFNVPYLM